MGRRLALVMLVSCAGALALGGLASAATRLPGFHSPSGTITCLYLLPTRDQRGRRLPGAVLCSIAHARYADTLQQRCMNPNGEVGAGVDWHGWSLSPGGKGSILCSGGILYEPRAFRPTYVTLPYGRTMRHVGITCWSRVDGVTCRNRDGHGFFVAREAWRVW